MTISASIIDYIGKYEGGILVSVGIMYDKSFYEGIFYYTSDKMIITIDNNLKEKIGDIELHEDYIPFMESIINKVTPFEEINDKLNDLEDYINKKGGK
jgi:hypothetical protein